MSLRSAAGAPSDLSFRDNAKITPIARSEPAPIPIAVVIAAALDMPIAPSATTALSSRTPHPARLLGMLATDITIAYAARRSSTSVRGENSGAGAAGAGGGGGGAGGGAARARGGRRAN